MRIVVMSLVMFCAVLARAEHNILLLNSYHKGYKWTDDITAGIEDQFESNLMINLHVEYMDTKRIYDNEYKEHLKSFYSYKHKKCFYDLIICSDNNAFNYLRNYGNDIFGDSPVVFCGVNYFKDSDLIGHDNYTGVNENADMKAGIELALDLHPDRNTVHLITDSTTTGARIREELERLRPHFESQGVGYNIVGAKTMGDMIQVVANLGSQDIAYYTFFFKDAEGVFYEYDESIKLLSENCSAPIYGAWDFSLGHGIIGGMLISGYDQGVAAADMALRIVNGESPSQIPVLKQSPNRYKFDYIQLERYGVDMDRLPENAQILNKPLDLYDHYRSYIWNGIMAIVILLTVIVVLSIYSMKVKRAEQETLEVKNYLHNVFDSMPSILLGIDESGRIIDSNSTAREALGNSELSSGKQLLVEMMPELADQIPQILSAIRRGIEHNCSEIKVKKGPGEKFLDVAVFPVRSRAVHEAVVRIDDVSSKVKMNALMIQTEKMMSVSGLAAGMAHEINNPLGAIVQGAQNIVRRTSPDFKKNIEFAEKHNIDIDAVYKYLLDRRIFEFIDGIVKSGERAAKIISDMMVFSRKSGSQHTKEKMSVLVDQALDLVNHDVATANSFAQESVRVNKNYYGDSQVYCSTSEIEQVFLNIFKNAYQAMNEVEDESYIPELWVSVYSEGGWVRAEIRDNGPGMSETLMRRIFEPFYTTKNVGEGKGLGLSVAYTIMTQHHQGHLSVASHEGEGTTFTVKLPVC